MRNRSFGGWAAAALALAFVPAEAAAQSTSGQDLTPEERGAYVAVAGATDLFAIQSAELAVDKARQPEVRSFAQTIFAEHRSALEQLGDAARAVGLGELLPPGMLPMHWDMLRDLEEASGSRFDRLYVDQQVEAHEVAVELHRNFAANGHNTRLKEYAGESLPMAMRHLAEAQRLER
jgi:putative membrane protein